MMASSSSWPVALLEFLADIGRGLALDADDVIGAVFLRDRELVWIAGERDDRRAAAEQLGILNRVGAQAADAEHADHPIRAERAGIAELLDAAIGRQPCIGERRELLEFQATVAP